MLTATQVAPAAAYSLTVAATAAAGLPAGALMKTTTSAGPRPAPPPDVQVTH